MAVPCRMMPDAGAVTEDKPNWFQSWVPAHNVVVVGTFSCVTFCAFAAVANARRSVTHSSPKHRNILRAVGCTFCVLVEILIEIRLSRPEAAASGAIALEKAVEVPSRGKASAHAFLIGVLQDARLAKRQPCASSQQRKGRRGGNDRARNRCQPHLCGAEFPFETGFWDNDKQSNPTPASSFSYQLAPCPIYRRFW